MEIVIITKGDKQISRSENSMGAVYAEGQGLVIDGEPMKVTATSKSGDVLTVSVEPQKFCEDCGGALQSPSTQPLCCCR